MKTGDRFIFGYDKTQTYGNVGLHKNLVICDGKRVEIVRTTEVRMNKTITLIYLTLLETGQEYCFQDSYLRLTPVTTSPKMRLELFEDKVARKIYHRLVPA